MFDSVPEIPFLRGLIMGVLMAAPIGAVGVMCVKRSLSGAWLRAAAVGLGSATVDALFGAMAGLGLTIIATFLITYQTPLGVIGGVIVMGLGVATYRAPVSTTAITGLDSNRIWQDFAKAFTLSIANPATFLGAIGLFAALGPADPEVTRHAGLILVIGVFCGSILWWTFLTGITHLFRSDFGAETLRRFNRIEGAVIVVFGIGVVAVAIFNAGRGS